METLGEAARTGTIPGGRIEDGVLQIDKPATTVPDGVEDLILDLYRRIPDTRIATQTIPATVKEAPYILDGLLMNEAGRRIKKQYADTGGFTDHLFAVSSILGYAFIPRIRDLPSKRLYAFDPGGAPSSHRRQGQGGADQTELVRYPADRHHHGVRHDRSEPDLALARLLSPAK